MRNNLRHGRRSTSGFTLIELLVVIALTVILLSVLFAPLIQAFQFTEQAQATAQAQDAARQTTEALTRELGSAAAVRDTTGNFLDLPLLNKTGGQIIARAYNAYIDIVPPKAYGTILDPTVDRNTPTGTISSPLTGLSSGITGPDVGLPLSAGSTVVRYFIGPRYPIDPKYVAGSTAADSAGTLSQPGDPQPYSNFYDHLIPSNGTYGSTYTVAQGLNNTYQLYRANFQPYVLGTGANATTYGVNGALFATVNNAPYYDDPDFFRIVLIGDTDYVPGQGDSGVYTAATAAAHNDRVYNWFKISKEVISTRNIDLVGLPRAGKNIVYDSQGNPVDAYVTDTVNGKTVSIPVVRTTVNFAPALISNDPMAASNNSNISQGYGEDPTDETSLPYVPTLYQSEYGNWQGTPAITITKTIPPSGQSPSASTIVLQTREFETSDGTSYTLGTPNYGTAPAPSVGDFILANVSSGGAGTPVYDITAGAPIDAGGAAPANYDALLYDSNRGDVIFSIPALPSTPITTSPINPYFAVPPATLPTTTLFNYLTTSESNVLNLGNPSLLPGTPLIPPSGYTGTAVVTAVPNATVVVNSERVVGPDLSAGIVGTAPATDSVQYTRVPFGTTPTDPNTYEIDYSSNNITFPENYTPASVQIAFSYQNNLSQNGTSWYATDTLRASYYTAAVMRLNLGIRVYGAANSNSEYFTLNSQVGVGNSKAN